MSANDHAFWEAFSVEDFTPAWERQVGEPGPLEEQWPGYDQFLHNPFADLGSELGFPEHMSLASTNDWAIQQPAGATRPAFQIPEMPLGGPTPPPAALAPAPLPPFRQATHHRHNRGDRRRPHQRDHLTHQPGPARPRPRRLETHLTLQGGSASPPSTQAEAPPIPEGALFPWTTGLYPGTASLFASVATPTQPEATLPLAAPLTPAATHHATPATLAPPPQQEAGLEEFPHVCPLLRDDNSFCPYRPEEQRRKGRLPAIKDHIKRAHPWHYIPTEGAKAEDLMRMMNPLGAQTDEDCDKRMAWAKAELRKGTGARHHMTLWKDIVEGRR